MKILKEKHLEFYDQQIKAHEDKWRQYADTAINILIQEKRLFLGRIWGIQENQGNVVLRFNEAEVPRMKQPYFLGLTGVDFPSNPLTSKFSYKIFRESLSPRLYNGIKADIFTINYWKTEGSKSYILVNGFDLDLLNEIKEKYLDKNLHPLVVVAEIDPPIKYLEKLKEFIQKSNSDPILNLNLNMEEKMWHPKQIDNSISITNEVLKLIERNKTTIIQGPPGTGKSYLAAELCNFILKQGRSICVTALTNKALMEIASKPGLKEELDKGNVFKTNLSSDEKKILPKLTNAQLISPKQGDLLLSSYYKLAQKHSEIIEGAERFDFLIIEEASQAYLATFAMFNSIALKILIIGDHKQLAPVVINEEQAKSIHPKISGVINGLQTFAFNNIQISNRLIKTRRLTSDAAALTGLFYEGTLKSISELDKRIDFSSKFRHIFHENGGISIAKLSSAKSGFSEKDIFKFICKISREIFNNNPDLEIAILVPYADLESDIYTEYSRGSQNFKFLSINTVHKIQGLTTDLTIIYLPIRSGAFELNDNLFNVATSRATRGTLIITYQHIELVSSISPETKQFLKLCKDVSTDFNLFLKHELN